MAVLNLRDESPPAEEPPPSEEPLGLDLIRGWLEKPRPRLHRLWLWVPYLAEGVQKAYGWLRESGGPALRRAATRVWELRGHVDRLRARLEKAFPPGSRGREVAEHLATACRLFARSALLLVGIGREADRLPPLWTPDREPGKPPPKPEGPPAGNTPGRASETPGRRTPDRRRASTGAGPTGRDESDASVGSGESGGPGASVVPPGSPAKESSRSAPADSSPVPGLPPGPRADALAKLSKSLRNEILGLGKRPRKGALRLAIWRILNECGPADADFLGLLLGMDAANLAKRHLSPLVDHTVLARTIPDRINHPDQAYRTTGPPPGADGLPPIDE